MAKIFIATDAWTPLVNGVVRTMTATISELSNMGHNISVVSPNQFKTISCPGYQEIKLSLFPYKKIKKLIEEFEPDCIHIVTEGPIGSACRKYCIKHKLKFTTAYHTKFPEYMENYFGINSSISYAFLRMFHNKSSAVLVPTPSIIKELDNHGFKNLKIWSRGVDLDLFNPKYRNKKDDKDVVFLSVGRVAEEKNLEDFLELDLPGRKIVVGDGPDRKRLESTYSDVEFVGYKVGEDLAKIYANADVFVFPSRTDTFGLVLLEAMACGTPVAAYNVPSPIDVVKQGESGSLRRNLYRACMNALKCDRNRVRQYAENFSWKNCTKQFADSLVLAKN